MENDDENKGKKGFYDIIDDAVMQGVNAGVRAWNWTTGGTKADLASLLSIGSTASMTAGFYLADEFILGTTVALVFGYVSKSTTEVFHDVEKNEQRALENSAKNIVVEDLKNVFKRASYASAGVAAGCRLYIPYVSFDYLSTFDGLSIGALMHAAQYSVIRADSLPPRKNCISRGLEKMSEIYAQRRTKPVPVPVIAYERVI